MTTADLPAGVTIRRVETEDLVDVIRIESAVFPQPWPRDAFHRFTDEPGFLVAELEGTEESEIVGYVVADVVRRYGTEMGHVKDLAVAPEYRRLGVATALLDRALSVLADQGLRRAKLEVREGNDAARGLYDRFGFRLRRRLPGYYADGEDALVFVTELEAGDR